MNITTPTLDLSQAERSPEGWVIVRAEYRNDDPVVFDDCYHSGPEWVMTVVGTQLMERGSAYLADRNSWADADRRLRQQLWNAGERTIELIQTGGPGKPLTYRRILTLDDEGVR